MFDKVESDEREQQNKKPNKQDVNMGLVKKFWDMKRDPTDLEMLNLIQNPFSFHVQHKRNTPLQFFLNKQGPTHIRDLFMWFHQNLIPKTFQIGHDENCYKYNSRACFLFEKFFNEEINKILSHNGVPNDVISPIVETKLPEDVTQKDILVEENKVQTPCQFVDPAIASIIKDEAITMIDAPQQESNLLAQNQENTGKIINQPARTQPIDPAIVFFQNHNQ